MTPKEAKDRVELAVEMYAKLQRDLILLLSDYFRVKEGTDYNEWYLKLLKEVNSFTDKALEEISLNSKVAKETLVEALQEVGLLTYEDTLKEGGSVPSKYFSEVVKSAINQEMYELDNVINETLISHNLAPVLRNIYMNTLQNVTVLHSVGGLTLSEAVTKGVLEAYDKGIPTSFIDRGGNTWDIERYTKLVIRSISQRVWNDMRVEGMKELNTTTVYVPPHAKARPECSKCQGKFLDIRPIAENTSKNPSVYEFGYGTPSGHRGCNCTHIWIPVVEGVNKERVSEWTPKEAESNFWEDQRYKTLARRVKKTKEQLEILKRLGVDTTKKEKLLKTQQAIVKAYCKEKGIKRQRDLEQVGVLVKKHKDT